MLRTKKQCNRTPLKHIVAKMIEMWNKDCGSDSWNPQSSELSLSLSLSLSVSSHKYWMVGVSHQSETSVVTQEHVSILLEHFRCFLSSPNHISSGRLAIGQSRYFLFSHWSISAASSAWLVNTGGSSPRNLDKIGENRWKTP